LKRKLQHKEKRNLFYSKIENDLSLLSPQNMPLASQFDACTGERTAGSILPEIYKMSVAEKTLAELDPKQRSAFLKRQFSNSINFITVNVDEQ
jgi:hypothetical protein